MGEYKGPSGKADFIWRPNPQPYGELKSDQPRKTRLALELITGKGEPWWLHKRDQYILHALAIVSDDDIWRDLRDAVIKHENIEVTF